MEIWDKETATKMKEELTPMSEIKEQEVPYEPEEIRFFDSQGVNTCTLYLSHSPDDTDSFELELTDNLGLATMITINKSTFKYKLNQIEDRFEQILRQII